MTGDGPWWRIGPDGSPEGPFAADEIRAALRRGRLRCSDLVWSPTRGDWAALDRTALLAGDRSHRPLVLALVIAALAYVATLAGLWAMSGADPLYDRTAPPSLWVLRGYWLGPALAIVIVTAIFVRLGWRVAGRLPRRPRLARVLRAVATLAAVLGGVLTIGLLDGVTTDPQQIIATAGATYRIDASEPGRIVVSGAIGYGFGKALREALDAAPDPVRIEIDSPGGLAHEAVEAAEAIEARPGATVVAGWTCDSGCIVVLMGGTNRLAQRGSALGFHARSDVPAQAERIVLLGFDITMALTDIPSDAYLLRRGVPAEIIAETNRRGTDDLYWVPAETLLERGVLTGLVPADD